MDEKMRQQNSGWTSITILASALLLCCIECMAQATPTQETPVSSAITADVQQQNEAETSAYTLKVYSDLVLLDVVVRDAKGNLVKGLQRGDFSIKEDDVAQQLDSLEETTPPSGNRVRQEKVESTQELDRRTPEAPVTIFVLDELTTRFEDEYFARYSLQKYLSRQGEVLDQPVMLVARTVDRTMLLCDYTTSKKKVIDALNHHLVGNDWRNRNPNYADVQTSGGHLKKRRFTYAKAWRSWFWGFGGV